MKILTLAFKYGAVPNFFYLGGGGGGGGGQIAQCTAKGGAQSCEVAISPRQAQKKCFTCSF